MDGTRSGEPGAAGVPAVTAGETDGRVRVVLVDDEALIRAGLALLLESEPDMVVVGEAGDGRAGVEVVAGLQPDVVVMDIRMPVMDGVAATRILTSEDFNAGRREAIPVLILTTFNEDEAVHAALRAGASGFILKNSAPRILASAIRALAEGAGWLDPNVTRKLLEEFSNRPEPFLPTPAELDELTRREREVLASIARGMSNSDVAAALFLSEATVKTHVHRILMKLGVADRAQAVAAAYRLGLVRPDGRG
ncbi:response regulator transcription factor [Arthrobacter sp. 754]|uniref:response regulator transcription factor n=1 Tax=Arthrobacter sp. 754 TaxID=3156315 RepID=UPI0033944226